MIVPKTRE